MKHSVPYTPQQNSVVEHKNRTLKEMATCMLEDNYLYHKLCDEAIYCVVYVHNKFPHKALECKTPFEAWRGHKPNVSLFTIFVIEAWARIPLEKRKGLQPQIKE